MNNLFENTADRSLGKDLGLVSEALKRIVAENPALADFNRYLTNISTSIREIQDRLKKSILGDFWKKLVGDISKYNKSLKETNAIYRFLIRSVSNFNKALTRLGIGAVVFRNFVRLGGQLNRTLSQTTSLVTKLIPHIIKIIGPLSDFSNFISSLKVVVPNLVTINRAFANMGATFTVLNELAPDITENLKLIGQSVSFNSEAIKELAKQAFMFGIQFQTGLTRVNTILKLNSEGVKDLSKNIRSLVETTKFQVSSIEAVNAQYDIASAGFSSAADALKVLESSIKLSVIGYADLADVTNLTSKSLRAYGLGAKEAGKLTAEINSIVESGITTVTELSSTLGEVFTSGASIGIAREEVGAAISALTQVGFSTAEAGTSINQLLLSIASLSPLAQETINSLEIDGEKLQFDLATVQAKGLGESLNDLMKAAGGNIDIIRKVIPQITGLRAVFGLTANEGKNFKNALEGIKNASESDITKALNNRLRDTSARIKALDNQLKEFILSFNENNNLDKFFLAGLANLESLLKLIKSDSDITKVIQPVIASVLTLQNALERITQVVGALVSTFTGLFGVFFAQKAFSVVLGGLGSIVDEFSVLKALFKSGSFLTLTLRILGLDQFTTLSALTKSAQKELQESFDVGVSRRILFIGDSLIELKKYQEEVIESSARLQQALSIDIPDEGEKLQAVYERLVELQEEELALIKAKIVAEKEYADAKGSPQSIQEEKKANLDAINRDLAAKQTLRNEFLRSSASQEALQNVAGEPNVENIRRRLEVVKVEEEQKSLVPVYESLLAIKREELLLTEAQKKAVADYKEALKTATPEQEQALARSFKQEIDNYAQQLKELEGIRSEIVSNARETGLVSGIQGEVSEERIRERLIELSEKRKDIVQQEFADYAKYVQLTEEKLELEEEIQKIEASRAKRIRPEERESLINQEKEARAKLSAKDTELGTLRGRSNLVASLAARKEELRDREKEVDNSIEELNAAIKRGDKTNVKDLEATVAERTAAYEELRAAFEAMFAKEEELNNKLRVLREESEDVKQQALQAAKRIQQRETNTGVGLKKETEERVRETLVKVANEADVIASGTTIRNKVNIEESERTIKSLKSQEIAASAASDALSDLIGQTLGYNAASQALITAVDGSAQSLIEKAFASEKTNTALSKLSKVWQFLTTPITVTTGATNASTGATNANTTAINLNVIAQNIWKASTTTLTFTLKGLSKVILLVANSLYKVLMGALKVLVAFLLSPLGIITALSVLAFTIFKVTQSIMRQNKMIRDLQASYVQLTAKTNSAIDSLIRETKAREGLNKALKEGIFLGKKEKEEAKKDEVRQKAKEVLSKSKANINIDQLEKAGLLTDDLNTAVQKFANGEIPDTNGKPVLRRQKRDVFIRQQIRERPRSFLGGYRRGRRQATRIDWDAVFSETASFLRDMNAKSLKSQSQDLLIMLETEKLRKQFEDRLNSEDTGIRERAERDLAEAVSAVTESIRSAFENIPEARSKVSKEAQRQSNDFISRQTKALSEIEEGLNAGILKVFRTENDPNTKEKLNLEKRLNQKFDNSDIELSKQILRKSSIDEAEGLIKIFESQRDTTEDKKEKAYLDNQIKRLQDFIGDAEKLIRRFEVKAGRLSTVGRNAFSNRGLGDIRTSKAIRDYQKTVELLSKSIEDVIKGEDPAVFESQLSSLSNVTNKLIELSGKSIQENTKALEKILESDSVTYLNLNQIQTIYESLSSLYQASLEQINRETDNLANVFGAFKDSIGDLGEEISIDLLIEKTKKQLEVQESLVKLAERFGTEAERTAAIQEKKLLQANLEAQTLKQNLAIQRRISEERKTQASILLANKQTGLDNESQAASTTGFGRNTDRLEVEKQLLVLVQEINNAETNLKDTLREQKAQRDALLAANRPQSEYLELLKRQQLELAKISSEAENAVSRANLGVQIAQNNLIVNSLQKQQEARQRIARVLKESDSLSSSIASNSVELVDNLGKSGIEELKKDLQTSLAILREQAQTQINLGVDPKLIQNQLGIKSLEEAIDKGIAIRQESINRIDAVMGKFSENIERRLNNIIQSSESRKNLFSALSGAFLEGSQEAEAYRKAALREELAGIQNRLQLEVSRLRLEEQSLILKREELNIQNKTLKAQLEGLAAQEEALSRNQSLGAEERAAAASRAESLRSQAAAIPLQQNLINQSISESISNIASQIANVQRDSLAEFVKTIESSVSNGDVDADLFRKLVNQIAFSNAPGQSNINNSLLKTLESIRNLPSPPTPNLPRFEQTQLGLASSPLSNRVSQISFGNVNIKIENSSNIDSKQLATQIEKGFSSEMTKFLNQVNQRMK